MSNIVMPSVESAHRMMPLDMGFSGAGRGLSEGSMSQNFSGPGGIFQNGGIGKVNNFAASAPLDQLVRQEQHLGLIRELTPPEEHIGLSIAPWLNVDTDDVVIDFINSTGGGLAPAVSQDAEAELFQYTEDIIGQMRASVIDWRLKSVYTSSDVMTYRQMKETAEHLSGANAAVPLYTRNILEGFQKQIARDTANRKLWLDNRVEWLIMTAVSTGKIEYNDGKISFKVDFGRPAGQHDQAPASGAYDSDTHDPINDIIKVVELMWEIKGVKLDRAYCSRKFLNTLYRSSKFLPRTGFAPGTSVDMRYLLDGWGPQAAIELIQRETGITFIVDDNVYRARNMSTGAITNTRYLPQDQVVFLPSEETINMIDGTEIGFAKTLTSPHPMGNWESGFYSWEAEQTDPWQHVIGSGVKAFPVFPHMDKTFAWKVTLPA